MGHFTATEEQQPAGRTVIIIITNDAHSQTWVRKRSAASDRLTSCFKARGESQLGAVGEGFRNPFPAVRPGFNVRVQSHRRRQRVPEEVGLIHLLLFLPGESQVCCLTAGQQAVSRYLTSFLQRLEVGTVLSTSSLQQRGSRVHIRSGLAFIHCSDPVQVSLSSAAVTLQSRKLCA